MPVLTPELEQWLAELHLEAGNHPAPNGAACVMEAVAYVAHEPWSDHPECASPILTSFLIGWNDAMNDDDRQMLKPYIPRLVGTRTGTEHEEQRAWMLTDWLARECAPAFLRVAGLTDQAELLEQLAPIVDRSSAKAAQPALDEGRSKAAAAWAAAWDAAWAAAWDAARAAAWDAARAAAYKAAKPLIDEKLAPAVKSLQASALLLLDRMISVSEERTAA